MPLNVVWFCTGASPPSSQTPGDLDVHRYLMALKGRPFEGEAYVPVAGERRRLDRSNKDDATDWFGEMVAAYLRRQAIRPPICFVPIPAPNITLESSTGPWTSILTMSIVTKLEGDVETIDVLRWKKKVEDNSPQDTAALFDNMTLIRKVDWNAPVILVGYLISGAGILQAAAAHLRESGAQVIHALYAGRIVRQPPKEPFTVMRAEIADFTPR
jgi:hypothetical protein